MMCAWVWKKKKENTYGAFLIKGGKKKKWRERPAPDPGKQRRLRKKTGAKQRMQKGKEGEQRWGFMWGGERGPRGPEKKKNVLVSKKTTKQELTRIVKISIDRRKEKR